MKRDCDEHTDQYLNIVDGIQDQQTVPDGLPSLCSDVLFLCFPTARLVLLERRLAEGDGAGTVGSEGVRRGGHLPDASGISDGSLGVVLVTFVIDFCPYLVEADSAVGAWYSGEEPWRSSDDRYMMTFFPRSGPDGLKVPLRVKRDE